MSKPWKTSVFPYNTRSYGNITHRITGVGRELWGLAHSLLKQVPCSGLQDTVDTVLGRKGRMKNAE